MDPCEQHAIRRFKNGAFSADHDEVIREARVELIVNDDELRLAMLCLPRELRELAVGFLRTEGALRRREDLVSDPDPGEYAHGSHQVGDVGDPIGEKVTAWAAAILVSRVFSELVIVAAGGKAHRGLEQRGE